MPPVHRPECERACAQALKTFEPRVEERRAQRGGLRQELTARPPLQARHSLLSTEVGWGPCTVSSRHAEERELPPPRTPSPLTSSSWWPSRRPAFSAREPGLTKWTKLPLALPPSRLSWEMRPSPLSVVCCTERPGPRTCPTDVTDGRKGLGQERRGG